LLLKELERAIHCFVHIEENRMSLTNLAAAAAMCCMLSGLAAAQSERIAGDVVALDGSTLTVRASAGATSRLTLPADARITARTPVTWAQINQGSYVGTTAVPQPDGTLLAKEVHVFPEPQRGRGEGHHPMATPGDTMTNATVASVSAPRPRDTMTNATVAAASSGPAAHRLTLTYKGGEKTVVVPDGVPLIASEPGDRSLLVPGAHVVVYVRPDGGGAMTVERMSVGKDGYKTPI
jgi:hypothetical protein